MLQMNLITRKELYWEVYWKLFDEVGKELFWSLKIPILTDFRGYNTD